MAMTTEEWKQLQRAAAYQHAVDRLRAAEAKRNEALVEMDRAVARAANLRWHAVYGAVLSGMLNEVALGAEWSIDDADMATCVARARAIADQKRAKQEAADQKKREKQERKERELAEREAHERWLRQAEQDERRDAAVRRAMVNQWPSAPPFVAPPTEGGTDRMAWWRRATNSDGTDP